MFCFSRWCFFYLSLFCFLNLYSTPQVRIIAVDEMAEQDFLRAQRLYQIDELAASILVLERILETYSKSDVSFKAVLFLSDIYLKQNQPEKVKQNIEKYIAIHPKLSEVNLASLNDLKKKSEIAISLKEKPEKIDVSLPSAVPLVDANVSVVKITNVQEYPVSASTIGLILPLSGAYAVYGERILTAVQMALGLPIVKFNGQPFMMQKGNALTLVVGDSKGEALRAGNLVAEFLDKHHVIAILGDVLVDSSLAVSKRAEALAVTNLSLSRQDSLTKLGSWVFREGLTTNKQTKALVEKMVRERGIKKFAVLYPDHLYGKEMKESFIKEVKRLGGEVVSAIPYKPEETTFTSHVSKLGKKELSKNAAYTACVKEAKGVLSAQEKCKNLVVPTINFQALFVPDFPKTVSYVIPALLAQDFLVSQNERIVHSYQKRAPGAKPIQLIGPNSWNGDLLGSRLGEQIDGALFVDGINWAKAHPGMEKFKTEYKEKMGSDPLLLEAQAYDAALILSFLLTTSDIAKKIKTRQDLRDQLLQLKNFSGLTGLISFDENGDSVAELQWFTFEKGQFRAL